MLIIFFVNQNSYTVVASKDVRIMEGLSDNGRPMACRAIAQTLVPVGTQANISVLIQYHKKRL